MDALEFLVGNDLGEGTTKLRSNYQIIIEYDGTNYNGYSIKNGTSIQNEIEKALKKVLKKKKVIGSAELTGVHAVGQSQIFYAIK